MKRIGIVGHFGGDEQFFDGQTIKTKNLYAALTDQYSSEDIAVLDTFYFRKNCIGFLFDAIKLIISCRNIIMLPDSNGVRVFIPLYCVLNIFLRRKLHYDVIGGWLPPFLERRKVLKWFAKKLDAIYVETSTMERDLKALGFQNVVILPNFKDIKALSPDAIKKDFSEPYCVCMFSRVMEEKGIEDAIEAVKAINSSQGRTVYKLDIYGQVDPDYEKRFFQLVRQFPEFISYKGTVAPEKSVDTVKNYFALLFPTKFYTEGIPGTLIDAYAAGVPVITALWVNACDVFENNVTGWGYEFGCQQELTKLLMKAYQQPDLFIQMREKALQKAAEYRPEVVIQGLVKRIE